MSIHFAHGSERDGHHPSTAKPHSQVEAARWYSNKKAARGLEACCSAGLTLSGAAQLLSWSWFVFEQPETTSMHVPSKELCRKHLELIFLSGKSVVSLQANIILFSCILDC